MTEIVVELIRLNIHICMNIGKEFISYILDQTY